MTDIAKKPKLQNVELGSVRAGQVGVGHYYAFYKTQTAANLDPNKDWTKLSKFDKEKLANSIAKTLSEGIPVFIAPDKTIHAIDQHHDMFAYSHLVPAQTLVPIQIARDFSKESLSHDDFQQAVLDNAWIYGKYVDEVLKYPIEIHALVDTPERSVMGMAFLHYQTAEHIPLKGKNFVPFIQFLLIDFIQAHQFMTFKDHYDPSDVKLAIELLRTSKDVKTFLRDRLVMGAPDKLKDFLKN